MTSPLGDGNGTREGCLVGCLLAVASGLLVLTVIAIAVQISAAVR